MNRSDPTEAALSFCLNAVKSLDQNKASEILKDKENASHFIKSVEGKLEPPILLKRTKMNRSTWSKQEKDDIGILQTQISALSVDVALRTATMLYWTLKRGVNSYPLKTRCMQSPSATIVLILAHLTQPLSRQLQKQS